MFFLLSLTQFLDEILERFGEPWMTEVWWIWDLYVPYVLAVLGSIELAASLLNTLFSKALENMPAPPLTESGPAILLETLYVVWKLRVVISPGGTFPLNWCRAAFLTYLESVDATSNPSFCLLWLCLAVLPRFYWPPQTELDYVPPKYEVPWLFRAEVSSSFSIAVDGALSGSPRPCKWGMPGNFFRIMFETCFY